MCKISEKISNHDLNITLEVHEGKLNGRYSIEGTAQMSGFSFVVRMAAFGLFCFTCEKLINEMKIDNNSMMICLHSGA